MSDTPPLIRLANARRAYGDRWVLVIDELEIDIGQKVLLWGGNGSGKSTLLRVLADITPLSSGSRSVSPTFARQRLAFLPQHGGLYNDLTLEQNSVALAGLYGVHSRSDWISWVDEIGSARRIRFGELSGGLRRVAALGALLSICPRILFLDEPLAGLDESYRRIVWRWLADTAQDRILTVLTSHSADPPGKGWSKLGLIGGRLFAEPR